MDKSKSPVLTAFAVDKLFSEGERSFFIIQKGAVNMVSALAPKPRFAPHVTPPRAPLGKPPLRLVPTLPEPPSSTPSARFGGAAGGAIFTISALWSAKTAYDAVKAVPSQLPWMPGKPVDSGIWSDPKRVQLEAHARFGHMDTGRLNTLKFVREKQAIPMRRDPMHDPHDRNLFVQDENGEWVRVPLAGQQSGALEIGTLWEHGLPGKPMHERAGDELRLIEIELGRRNFQDATQEKHDKPSWLEQYMKYIQELVEALRKRAAGENVPLPIFVIDTQEEAKMPLQTKPQLMCSSAKDVNNNESAISTTSDVTDKGTDATTPYEERYRAVYDAGGTRFYPKTPSRNLSGFLAQPHKTPGTAVVVGCGEGRNISPLIEAGWDVVGIDSARSALKVAAQDNQNNKRVKLIWTDILDAKDVPDGSADLIVVIEFLHLLTSPADRKKLYNNIHRMLRPNGVVFFENNGRLQADEPIQLQGGKVEPRTIQTDSGPRQIPLVRLPTVMLNGSTLKAELEGAGFVVDDMRADAFQHPDTLREQIVTIVHKRHCLPPRSPI